MTDTKASLGAKIFHLVWLGGLGMAMMYKTCTNDPQFALKGASMFPGVIGWTCGNEIIREILSYFGCSQEFTVWYKDTHRRFLYALFVVSISFVFESIKWQTHLMVYWSMFVFVAWVLSSLNLHEETRFYLWMVINLCWFSANDMHTNVWQNKHCATLVYRMFGVIAVIKLAQGSMKHLTVFAWVYMILLLGLMGVESVVIEVCLELSSK